MDRGARLVRRQRRDDRRLLRRPDSVVPPLAAAAAPEGDRAVRLAAEQHVAQRADLRRLLPAADGRVGARYGPAVMAGARLRHAAVRRAAGLLRRAAAVVAPGPGRDELRMVGRHDAAPGL